MISNLQAANALLKMLEEPPLNTIFLSRQPCSGGALALIRSRCRRLDFQRVVR